MFLIAVRQRVNALRIWQLPSAVPVHSEAEPMVPVRRPSVGQPHRLRDTVHLLRLLQC